MNRIQTICDSYMAFCNVDCRNCWAIRFCANSCYTIAVCGETFDLVKRRIVCGNIRKTISQAIVKYIRIVKRKPSAFEILRAGQSGEGERIVSQEAISDKEWIGIKKETIK